MTINCMFGPISEAPKGVIAWLSGRKSFICSVILFCLGGAYSLGWLSREDFEAWSIMVAGLLGISLRIAISKR